MRTLRPRQMAVGRMLSLVMAATVVSCTVGCVGHHDPPPEKYGVAFNAQRKKLGIPILPDDWTWYRREWRTPERPPSSLPHHYLKAFVLDGDKPLWERDEYYTGKTIPIEDPDWPEGSTSPQTLAIWFHYDRHRAGEPPWRCYLGGVEGEIAIEKADEILESCGLSRTQSNRP